MGGKQDDITILITAVEKCVLYRSMPVPTERRRRRRTQNQNQSLPLQVSNPPATPETATSRRNRNSSTSSSSSSSSSSSADNHNIAVASTPGNTTSSSHAQSPQTPFSAFNAATSRSFNTPQLDFSPQSTCSQEPGELSSPSPQDRDIVMMEMIEE